MSIWFTCVTNFQIDGRNIRRAVKDLNPYMEDFGIDASDLSFAAEDFYFNTDQSILRPFIFNYPYYWNFNGDSLGQVEEVDVGDVAKWRQKFI